MKAAMDELTTKHILGDKPEETEEGGGPNNNNEEPSEEPNGQPLPSSPSPPPPEKFVNTGLQRWEEIRNEWLSSASSSSYSSSSTSTSTSANTNNDPSSTTITTTGKNTNTTRGSSNRRRKHKKPKRHASDVDIDEVIDLIVSNRWRQQPPKNLSTSSSSLDTAKSATRRRDDACFPSPVALPQMVDVLVDLWEAEGLDI
mmetsp:Transcript_7347/g.16011  ORF Transcript_7347/g.16011 Transcript_7347/m.16011 type:complete len:200 (+) Transcript_7347:92-691(+)